MNTDERMLSGTDFSGRLARPTSPVTFSRPVNPIMAIGRANASEFQVGFVPRSMLLVSAVQSNSSSSPISASPACTTRSSTASTTLAMYTFVRRAMRAAVITRISTTASTSLWSAESVSCPIAPST